MSAKTIFSTQRHHKFRQHLKILDNDSLQLTKAKLKHQALYVCIVNDTIAMLSYNYAYFVNVLNPYVKHSLTKTGPLIDWIKYRDDIILSLETIIENEYHANLLYEWTEWSLCLCGSFKYDTRCYRSGYCIVKLSNNLLLSCHSNFLMNFNQNLTIPIQNISNFYEYKRCMDDCVQGLLRISWKTRLYSFCFSISIDPQSVEMTVKKFKFKKAIQVIERFHIEINCPKYKF